MYPFPQSVTPAVRTHLDAQTAFVNDMSKSLFRSFQQMCELNIQLAQTMLEETTLASQHVLNVDRQSELLGAASARAQPATEKLRAYQQHVSRLATDAQVELARVAEQHVQATTRTARAVVDEVARTSAEETERGIRSQQEALRTMTDPFTRADGAGNARADGAAQSAQQTSQQAAQQAAQQATQALQAGQQGRQALATH
ncbi:phasin family protein [Massilia timonae]|uniref:phasin family protein n=1 Tax=Massilia timonae TaxID=47229 RepID=UPI000ED4796A|nr:phasin family protein [Massilia timonae]HAK92157.1 granule-associated protein [Massilia timonae]